MMGALRGILSGAALVLCSQATLAGAWVMAGRVVHVADGDTLTLLLPDRTQTTIRLSDIDSPESGSKGRPGQPYSHAAKQSLLALVKGQEASATCYEHDRWDRAVCTVSINGLDVNAQQLRLGMAWVNGASRRYVRNPRSYDLAAQAQAARIGLWAGQGAQQPVPPWEWRQRCWKQGDCEGAYAPENSR